VTPRPNWLQTIVQASDSNPQCAVFGGKIEVVWPNDTCPRWASASWIQIFAFALHDLGSETHPYEPGTYPFGPNMWVRASVFSRGLRYNERIGPQPKKRLMGSETTFLRALERAGHEMLYVPDGVVGHRIQARELNKKIVARRAARLGRSSPHVFGLPDESLLSASPLKWTAKRLFLIARAYMIRLKAVMTLEECKRFERDCAGRASCALHSEAIRLAFMRTLAKNSAAIHSNGAPA
jgi:hypothetical protein